MLTNINQYDIILSNKKRKEETVAKFIKDYSRVECLEANNVNKFVGQVGTLLIFESENLMKGKKWVKFIGDNFLQTSPGDIEIENNVLTLKTHNGEHIYKFKIRKE